VSLLPGDYQIEFTTPQDSERKNHMIRALHITIPANPTSKDEDHAVVDAFCKSRPVKEGVFNLVILRVPTWQEVPEPYTYYPFWRILGRCRNLQIRVVFVRSLFVGFPGMIDDTKCPKPSVYAHYDPAYYAAAIQRVRTEALALGANFSGLDYEIYGNNAPQDFIRHRELSRGEQRGVEYAVSSAVRVVGRVDWGLPGYLWKPSYYPWYIEGVAQLRINESTYQIGPKADWQHDTANPPEGKAVGMDLWGSWMFKNLTIEEALAFPLDSIRERYPQCLGQMIYYSPIRFCEGIKDEAWLG
jgi:hypothetical protein